MSHVIILFFLFILVTQLVSVSNQQCFFLRIHSYFQQSTAPARAYDILHILVTLKLIVRCVFVVLKTY